MKKTLYYGWIIALIAFATMAVSYALRYSYTVFFVALYEEFGWSRASTATAFSITMVVYAIMNPLTGAALDRYGPRKLFPAGAVVLGLGLLGSSQLTSLWHYYFFSGVIAAIGMASLGVVTNNTLISHWFVKKRGTVMGLAASGMGAGMVILVPFAQWMISHYGFRWAYASLGLLSMLIIAPITGFFLYGHPQDLGLLPDGKPHPTEGEESTTAQGTRPQPQRILDARWADTDWTLAKALRTSRFWVLLVGVFFLLVGLYAVMMHQVSHTVDVGFSKLTAAAAFGLLGFMGGVGKAGWGFLSDRIGREMALTLGLLSTSFGVIFLLLLKDPSQLWMLYVYTALFGLGYGAIAPVLAALTADLFQGRNLGSIYGFIVTAAGLGGALGPPLAGYMYDVTGTYQLAFTISLLLIAFSCISIWVAAPRKVRPVMGWALTAARKAKVEPTTA